MHYLHDEDIDYIIEEEAFVRRRRERQKKIALRRKQEKRRKRIITLCAVVALCICGISFRFISKGQKDTVSEEKSSAFSLFSFGRGRDKALTDSGSIDPSPGALVDKIDSSAEDFDESDPDAPSESDLLTPYTEGHTEKEIHLSSTSADYDFFVNSTTQEITSDQVISTHAILVDCKKGTVEADREGTIRVNPASMTKIMTILAAAEELSDIKKLDDTISLSQSTADFIFKNDCSAVGFSLDEKITVRDLFYGTILPSGADAALELAIYTSGSHEAFMDLINQKFKELGISETTHFTNCIGLYGDDHYTTLKDMAVILNAAMDNELCREILSTRQYTTSSTTEHPDGISISNWFLRRIDDKDCMGEVIGAKTGFVNESGNCAASFYTSDDGRDMICVTAGGTSAWRTIYDHVAIYNIYANNNTSYKRG